MIAAEQQIKDYPAERLLPFSGITVVVRPDFL